MNGVKMNFNKYYQTLATMPKPIMPSELPKVKMNIGGLIAYARSVGKQPVELSEEEVANYIEGDYKSFYEEHF